MIGLERLGLKFWPPWNNKNSSASPEFGLWIGFRWNTVWRLPASESARTSSLSCSQRGPQLSCLRTLWSHAAPALHKTRYEVDSIWLMIINGFTNCLSLNSRVNKGYPGAVFFKEHESSTRCSLCRGFCLTGHLSFTVKWCDHSEKMLEPCLASKAPEVQTEGNSFSSLTSEQGPAVRYVNFSTQYTEDGLKNCSALTDFIEQAGFSYSDVEWQLECGVCWVLKPQRLIDLVQSLNFKFFVGFFCYQFSFISCPLESNQYITSGYYMQ